MNQYTEELAGVHELAYQYTEELAYGGKGTSNFSTKTKHLYMNPH